MMTVGVGIISMGNGQARCLTQVDRSWVVGDDKRWQNPHEGNLVAMKDTSYEVINDFIHSYCTFQKLIRSPSTGVYIASSVIRDGTADVDHREYMWQKFSSDPNCSSVLLELNQ
jgi:hypothetical protein